MRVSLQNIAYMKRGKEEVGEKKLSCQWEHNEREREKMCCELYPIALDWTHGKMQKKKKKLHTMHTQVQAQADVELSRLLQLNYL